jgi:hypothetical protein
MVNAAPAGSAAELGRELADADPVAVAAPVDAAADVAAGAADRGAAGAAEVEAAGREVTRLARVRGLGGVLAVIRATTVNTMRTGSAYARQP